MSHTRDQKRFTISEVAADWHELMIPQRTMRSSIARVGEQLDPRFAASRHTTTPVSHIQRKHYTAAISSGKKPRKTTEEMDGQCKRRYGSKEVECTTSNGSGVGQKQMETAASSSLKLWKRAEEEEEEVHVHILSHSSKICIIMKWHFLNRIDDRNTSATFCIRAWVMYLWETLIHQIMVAICNI